MKPTESLTYIYYKLQGTNPSSIASYGSALRKCGAFVDGRLTYPQVRPSHVAAALLVFALAPPTNDDKLVEKIEELLNLKDSEGVTVLEALTEFLDDDGNIYVKGLARVSVSLTRPCVVFAFKDPEHQEELAAELEERPYDKRYIAVREHDRVFGGAGARSFERFSMIKGSLMKEIANELSLVTQPAN